MISIYNGTKIRKCKVASDL